MDLVTTKNDILTELSTSEPSIPTLLGLYIYILLLIYYLRDE